MIIIIIIIIKRCEHIFTPDLKGAPHKIGLETYIGNWSEIMRSD